jgi:hypothetical protein
VEDFICNTCRFEKKKKSDWEIEGPSPISHHSVISANHYTSLNQAKIETLKHQRALGFIPMKKLEDNKK